MELTIGTIIQKDSNKNGIADWEEYLWGLNPEKNGKENKEFIENKKKELEKSGVIKIADDSAKITENELLSREFFATIVALQQTGELNTDSIQTVSDAIGRKIDITNIPDKYTSNLLKIQNDSLIANTTYRDNFGKLVTKYQDADIGSELTFIVQGLGNKDPSALYAAQTVASAYKSFGNDLMKIPVPKSLSAVQLSLANNYEKTGQSIEDLSKMLSDPIIGMGAIVNYKKYSDATVSDLEKLSEILQ